MYECVRCSQAKNPREIISHHYAETSCTALSVTTEGKMHFCDWSIPPVAPAVSRLGKQSKPLWCTVKEVLFQGRVLMLCSWGGIVK